MDRGAWQATVPRATKSQTWLKWLSTQESSLHMWKRFSMSLLTSFFLLIWPRQHTGFAIEVHNCWLLISGERRECRSTGDDVKPFHKEEILTRTSIVEFSLSIHPQRLVTSVLGPWILASNCPALQRWTWSLYYDLLGSSLSSYVDPMIWGGNIVPATHVPVWAISEA